MGPTHKRILRYLSARVLGATDEEMALDLGIPANTVRPRRQELVHMGKVEASPHRRLTFSKHEAIVWAACDHEPPEPAARSRAKRVAAAAAPFVLKAEEVVASFPDSADCTLMRVVLPLRALRALVAAAGD